jgi:hypothetical protein
MTFPARIGFGAWSLPPHPVFELLAFAVALALLRRSRRHDPLAAAQRSTVLIGGLAGSLLGAKGLVLLEHRALRGVLLGALITTLVNGAACFGVMR